MLLIYAVKVSAHDQIRQRNNFCFLSCESRARNGKLSRVYPKTWPLRNHVIVQKSQLLFRNTHGILLMIEISAHKRFHVPTISGTARTKISMTLSVGLCAIVMVTNVISQHAAVCDILFNTLLKWSVWAMCNDKLLHSAKPRYLTKETPSRYKQAICKHFVKRRILFPRTEVKAERVKLTLCGRLSRHARSTNAIFVDCISQLCRD